MQDIGSRYPTCKLVSSTKAEKVIPALKEIYNEYGSPEVQISDNGPPFNSKAMEEFAIKNNKKLQKIAPLHPSSNPAECFMRPLGKTMKIAHMNRDSEKEALDLLLRNYRDTPHSATGISPAAMLFRDDKYTDFPRKPVTDNDIIKARIKDTELKAERTEKINSSKYKKHDQVCVGDIVLIRNYNKKRKFDPLFLTQTYSVIETSDHYVTVRNNKDNNVLKRHRDDIKLISEKHNDEISNNDICQNLKNRHLYNQYIENCDHFDRHNEIVHNNEYDSIFPFQGSNTIHPGENETAHKSSDNNTNIMDNLDDDELRRPQRTRKQNPRYYNNDILTDF